MIFVPCLCIRLDITDCPPIWKVKRATKRAYPSFRQFSCAIAHHFLVDPDSDDKNVKLFRGLPSRPCICIRLAITACPTHLEAHDFLCYPDSDVKNAKFFCGRPSRPCVCIRLSITACPTHLECQRSPEASYPSFRRFSYAIAHTIFWRAYPSFRRFSCAIANHFLVDLDSDVKNAKFFVDVRQDLVKRAPNRAYPSFQRFSCAIAHHFLVDPDSDVKNAKCFVDVCQDLSMHT
uniref:Uncharacterized protein n=1 Tax=Solanum lycopersicum TaxID=4081 RepID=A0A494G8P4_SOLLC